MSKRKHSTSCFLLDYEKPILEKSSIDEYEYELDRQIEKINEITSPKKSKNISDEFNYKLDNIDSDLYYILPANSTGKILESLINNILIHNNKKYINISENYILLNTCNKKVKELIITKILKYNRYIKFNKIDEFDEYNYIQELFEFIRDLTEIRRNTYSLKN